VAGPALAGLVGRGEDTARLRRTEENRN
jgi:hypothetical protein